MCVCVCVCASIELERLVCVNDYLYNISCSLTVSPTDEHPDNRSSYRLQFREEDDDFQMCVTSHRI